MVSRPMIASLASLLATVLLATVLLAVPATASPTASPDAVRGIGPYYDPPFASSCVVHYFGEGVAPNLKTLTDDPLCVDYAKRDITLTDGGVVRFLLAEPARFAIAGTKCSYWQQDHWSVQGSPGQVPVIRWDGSYWWDLGTGQGGARLTGLTIAGQPATLARAAAAVAPYSPQLAAYFLAYSHGGDGVAVTAGFPFDPLCPR